MNGSFGTWWRSRTLREQRLLLAMSGLLSVVLLWLLLIRPLGDALSNARERHSNAALVLAEARAQAALIRQLEGSAPAKAFAEPIDALVSRSATEAGFPIARLEREGTNQATLVLASVRPQAFFGWLAQMESRGLIVERLNASTNSDRTLTIQVSFRGRGR
jgi:general secretion pathway protein M